MTQFFWGAATSAHQVEGNNHNDWSEFERERGLEPSGAACDHYNRFREDFDIARDLGHNAHRFSIEWSRVEPEEGKFDEKEIGHYREVIHALRERNIEPFVTLWHWTIPLWLRDKGGWTWKKTPALFARFAERMVKEFPEVKYWVTLNEPNVYTGHGYWEGNWPPGISSLKKLLLANHRLIRGHTLAYKTIKKIHKEACVGITQNIIWFSRWENKPKDIIWNHLFIRTIKHFQDFIGVNYYFSDRNLENKTDVQWSIDPEGLYHVLKNMRRYKKPVYILENGIANSPDTKRADFIRDHVAAMQKAMQEGADVRGYFYWSLLDNFEWDKGFWPCFGLVEVDYKTMRRTVRKSALEYQKIIESKDF